MCVWMWMWVIDISCIPSLSLSLPVPVCQGKRLSLDSLSLYHRQQCCNSSSNGKKWKAVRAWRVTRAQLSRAKTGKGVEAGREKKRGKAGERSISIYSLRTGCARETRRIKCSHAAAAAAAVADCSSCCCTHHQQRQQLLLLCQQ